jgi:uncharacterized membrane protein
MSVGAPRFERAAMGAVGIATVALGLYLYRIGSDSFWFDEAASAHIALAPWSEFFRSVTTTDAAMPLYYVILRPWSAIDSGETFLRLLSALSAAAAVWVTYRLARQWFDGKTSLMAAALVAVNPTVLYYAQEARGFTLCMFLVTLATLVFVRALHGTASWGLYAVLGTLAVATHLHAAFAIVAHAIALSVAPVSKREKRDGFVAVGTCLVAAVAVAIPLLRLAARGVYDWLDVPGMHDFTYLVVSLVGQPKWIVPIVLLGSFGLLWSIWRGIPRDDRWRRWMWTFLATACAFPVVAAFLISQVRPIFNLRYFLFVVPFISIALAGLLASTRRWLVTGFVFAALLGASLSLAVGQYDRVKPDWRGAIHHIVEDAQPGDFAAVLRDFNQVAYEYYAGREDSPVHLIFPGHGMTTQSFFAGVESRRVSPQRLWLVISDDFRDRSAEATDVMETSYRQVEMDRFYGLSLYLYERR